MASRTDGMRLARLHETGKVFLPPRTYQCQLTIMDGCMRLIPFIILFAFGNGRENICDGRIRERRATHENSASAKRILSAKLDFYCEKSCIGANGAVFDEPRIT